MYGIVLSLIPIVMLIIYGGTMIWMFVIVPLIMIMFAK
jgi:hypothetical protein